MSYTFCFPLQWRIGAGLIAIGLSAAFLYSARQSCSGSVGQIYQIAAIVWMMTEITFLVFNLATVKKSKKQRQNV